MEVQHRYAVGTVIDGEISGRRRSDTHLIITLTRALLTYMVARNCHVAAASLAETVQETPDEAGEMACSPSMVCG